MNDDMVKMLTNETAVKVVPFATAALVLLTLVVRSEIGVTTVLVRLICAAAIAGGALLGRAQPAMWGVVAGASAVTGAMLVYDITFGIDELGVLVGLAAIGGCGIAALIATQTRWVRSPLTEPRLAVALAATGGIVTLGLGIAQKEVFANPGIAALGCLVALVVVGGCLIAGSLDRSFWGRCAVAGAAGPVVVNLTLNQLLEKHSWPFYVVDSPNPQSWLTLAGFALAGLVVAAHLTSKELVVDVPVPQRRQPAIGFVSADAAHGSFGHLSAQVSIAPTGIAPTVYGSVGARFGGMLVDALVGGALSVPGYALIVGGAGSGSGGTTMLGLMALIAGEIYFIVSYCRRVGRTGQSWGHKACGVRVVDARTGGPIGAGRAFGRALMRGVAGLPCYLGLFWALWDPQRRGWHDIVVGTVVVPATLPFVAASPQTQALASPTGIVGAPLMAPPPAPAAVPVPSRFAPLDEPAQSSSMFSDATVSRADLAAFQSAASAAASAPFAPVAPVAPAVLLAPAPAAPFAPAPVVAPAPALPAPLAPASLAPAPFAPAPFAPAPFAPALAIPPVVPFAPANPSPIPRAPAAFVASVPSTALALRFDDGETLTLDRVVLIGRDPSTSADDPGALLVALDDRTMSVSKTHLAIGVDAGRVWVEDRHSTNGVSVADASGGLSKLVVGHRVTIASGTRVQFGDRWVEVTGR